MVHGVRSFFNSEAVRGVFASVGRVFLGGFFCVSGISSLLRFEQYLEYVAAVPVFSLSPVFFGSIVIVLQIVAGFSLALGVRTRAAAASLAVLTVSVTPLFHLAPGGVEVSLLMNFLLLVGLCCFIGFGGGRFTAHAFIRRPRSDV